MATKHTLRGTVMNRFLAFRSRIAGTIQDTLAGIAIVCFLVVVLAYLEAFA